MPRYDVVLFDADNTLFDFDRSEREALAGLLRAHGLPGGAADVALYHKINQGLWDRFDRGEVRREWLVVERFRAFLEAAGRQGDPRQLNREYLRRLGESGHLLPGAYDLCRSLDRCCTLAIVTNGVAVAQRGRFERSPLKELIPWLFISEEVGASKPDPAFFAPVLAALGVTDRSRVLMVGDNLLTDIQGGANAGLDTAWYRPGHAPRTAGIVPTYEADSYRALEALILNQTPEYRNK